MTRWAGVTVTHQGVKQTFVSALPTLLQLAKKADKHRVMLGCRMPGAGHLHAVPAQAQEIKALAWNVCPLDLLGCPQLAAVFELDRLAKVAPLSGWPDRYAPWAVIGLMAVRDAREGGS